MNGNYISLAEAAKLVPGRPNVRVLHRWARKGRKAPTNQRIHLECVERNGQLWTTKQRVEKFVRLCRETE